MTLPSSSSRPPAAVDDRRPVAPSASTASRDLDDRPVTAGAHPGRVAATAGDQAERGDDHGLAGAGLTGDDGETGVRFEHGVVDDAEVADPQFCSTCSR